MIAPLLLLVNLLPMPASVEMRPGQLKLGASFDVRVEKFSDDRLLRALDRFKSRFAKGGIQMVLRVDGAGQAVQGIDEDESYSLNVDASQAVLAAPTVVGAMRGLETLRQLYVADGAYFANASIKDKPRFPWRGLMIDACRHWEPVEVIKRNLDGMSAAKLNVFHWHLSEDQGFRVESKKYPKLQQMGSDLQYYSQDEVRDIVAYARDRGIRVIPEFDMPGHTTAWFVGYPELASAPGPYQIARTFGVFDPTIDPTREETYVFLDGFLGEMSALFPDAFLHIGGDENNGKQWAANPAIVAFRKEHNLADNHALQAYFNRRLLTILTKYNKRMIGWDEIFHPDLPKDIVVQSWRGAESLASGAKQGYAGILSAGFYLDHIDAASKHYELDPMPAGLTPAQSARILGGEACMWGEHVTPQTIDSRIWPRVAAIAERFWSPATVRDVPDMYRRLDAFSVSLDAVGLTHRKWRVKMLQDIAANLTSVDDQTDLITITNTMKPVSFGKRAKTPITQQTPLVGLVDATQPDGPEGRAMIALIQGGQKNHDPLEKLFTSWVKLPTVYGEGIAPGAMLRDMGRIGLEALSATKHTPKWKSDSLATLDTAAKLPGLLEFTIIPAMRGLVNSAQ